MREQIISYLKNYEVMRGVKHPADELFEKILAQNSPSEAEKQVISILRDPLTPLEGAIISISHALDAETVWQYEDLLHEIETYVSHDDVAVRDAAVELLMDMDSSFKVLYTQSRNESCQYLREYLQKYVQEKLDSWFLITKKET